MAFTQATAPTRQRTQQLLSADNSIPERHIVVETLRNAAPRLQLSAPVLSTLDAMISCLPPKRSHHTVFASNATLTFRRNGISERTIRRHAAILQEKGLLIRRDSPNRKRFTKHSAIEGKALRFGFDLSPLYGRLHELAALAAEALKEQEQIGYLRIKIRSAANQSLHHNPNNELAINTLRLLRRKLRLQDCERLLSKLPETYTKAETKDDVNTTPLTANDSQFDRHHQRSNIELNDTTNSLPTKDSAPRTYEPPITVPGILAICTEASKYSLKRIETVHDVIVHARTLAPMIGISNGTYEAAARRLGGLRAAATVWAIMQFHGKIRAVGAYFRSITTGAKSAGFSPERLLRQLAGSSSYAA